MGAWSAWAATLLIGMLLPGPANLAVLAAGVAGGARPATALGAGVVAGDALLAGAVIAGAGVLTRNETLQAVMTVGGGLLLAVIGLLMLFSPRPTTGRARDGRGAAWRAAGGLGLALGNPKAALLHLAAAPLIVGPGQGTPSLALAAVTVAAGLNVLAILPYLAAPRLAGAFVEGPRTARLVRLAGGGLVAAVGAGLAIRGLLA